MELFNRKLFLAVFAMASKGSDSVERRGATWALSHVDHPAAVSSKVLNRISAGTLAIVGLEKNEVENAICVL